MNKYKIANLIISGLIGFECGALFGICLMEHMFGNSNEESDEDDDYEYDKNFYENFIKNAKTEDIMKEMKRRLN